MSGNMTMAYFAAFVAKPVIITAPGRYLTRSGQTIEVTKSSDWHDFGCKGQYPCGMNDRWHKSGRLYAAMDSHNDIVSRA